MSKRDPRVLSAKLKAEPTLTLKSMASGLRCLKGGQKHLLKLLEEEIAKRESEGKESRS